MPSIGLSFWVSAELSLSCGILPKKLKLHLFIKLLHRFSSRCKKQVFHWFHKVVRLRENALRKPSVGNAFLTTLERVLGFWLRILL